MTYNKVHAERLRGWRYVIRPQGTLGTHGWIEGKPWAAIFVTARNEIDALRKAHYEALKYEGYKCMIPFFKEG